MPCHASLELMKKANVFTPFYKTSSKDILENEGHVVT